MEQIKKMAPDKSILAFWRQIHLKIQCQPHGTWQFSEIQYKSDRGREKKHPAAGQGSTRSQNSCQIEFSSINGREIGSSVYGTTRCPQLYSFLRVGRSICLWIKIVFVQVGKVLNRGATADERRQGATLRRQKYITCNQQLLQG